MRRVFNRNVNDVVTADRNDRTFALVVAGVAMCVGSRPGLRYLGGRILGYWESLERALHQQQMHLLHHLRARFSAPGLAPALVTCCSTAATASKQAWPNAGWPSWISESA
ncbi:MAG: hypothetical protein R3C99_25710 [Pirellulaceae bacterium]|nr:hypothetical protein [Planctomycetales bacterium]MCA9206563.1 hypothetical protein [Planctomycetales bacterium]MCA9208006.1 hypothetical protein [Planctomycetales bacterium]MCA9221393.1 hypothetical protein [Planctomycetales bacterium]